MILRTRSATASVAGHPKSSGQRSKNLEYAQSATVQHTAMITTARMTLRLTLQVTSRSVDRLLEPSAGLVLGIVCGAGSLKPSSPMFPSRIAL